MGEHDKPRLPPGPPPEKFFVNDAILKKSFPVRDCSDAQLERAFKETMQQHQAAVQSLATILQQIQNLASVSSMLAYEIDRRSRPAIKLATLDDLPRR